MPASKFFKETDESRAIADDARTEIQVDGDRPVTTKSKYNALAAV